MWAFIVEPDGVEGARLIAGAVALGTRAVAGSSGSCRSPPFMMERKMLRGIKRRAEELL